MITPREAFRIGFLKRCVDDGLTPVQTRDRFEKAAEFLEKQGTSMLGEAGGALNKLLGSAATYGVALPIAAGVGGGYLANKMTEDDLDEDDVRKRELIEELQHWTRRANEQNKLKLMRPIS